MYIIRRGGQYARDQQRLYKVKALVTVLASIILYFFLSSFWVFILFGLSLYYLERYRNWGKGILGERLVVDALTPLDDSYVLINDVVLFRRKGNIDHILISPTGLFVIETKNYRWSDLSRFPIKQVIRNAVSLRYFLKEHLQLDMFVHALLVFTDPDITASQSYTTFHIRSPGNLCDFIKDHKTHPVLNRDTIRKLAYEILRVSRLNEKGINIKRWLLKPALSIGLILVAYTSWTISGGNPYGEWVLVTSVTDGDTIHVGRGWRDTTVRLLGVGTSETVHPNKPVEFFGLEASRFTKKALKGKKVRLEIEPFNQKDDYGLLLAYIYLEDGTLFNAELIKKGYARVIAPFTFRYYKEFHGHEKEAKASGVGIWAAKKETVQTMSEAAGEIIGNKGSKIYHIPGQANYGRVKEESRVYFGTEDEAIRAGYRKAKR